MQPAQNFRRSRSRVREEAEVVGGPGVGAEKAFKRKNRVVARTGRPKKKGAVARTGRPRKKRSVKGVFGTSGAAKERAVTGMSYATGSRKEGAVERNTA